MHRPGMVPEEARRVARALVEAIDRLDYVSENVILDGWPQARSKYVDVYLGLVAVASLPYDQDAEVAR